MRSIDVRRFEARLRRRLDELQGRLSAVDAELGQPTVADAEERAQDRESDEVLESLGAAGQQEIRMIEGALERIADGTFGDCVACGEPISKERLEAVPHAARCIKCA